MEKEDGLQAYRMSVKSWRGSPLYVLSSPCTREMGGGGGGGSVSVATFGECDSMHDQCSLATQHTERWWEKKFQASYSSNCDKN